MRRVSFIIVLIRPQTRFGHSWECTKVCRIAPSVCRCLYLPKSLNLKEYATISHSSFCCVTPFYSSNAVLHLFTVKYFPNFTWKLIFLMDQLQICPVYFLILTSEKNWFFEVVFVNTFYSRKFSLFFIGFSAMHIRQDICFTLTNASGCWTCISSSRRVLVADSWHRLFWHTVNTELFLPLKFDLDVAKK